MSQQLHHFATLEKPLTREEQAQLAAWLAQNDAEEAEKLFSDKTSETLETLRSQLDQALTNVSQTSQQIRELEAGNQNLRRENERLRQQLASQSAVCS